MLQVTFYVLPHKDLGYKSFKRERLIANDFLQIRKVIEHVYEKVISGNVAGGSEGGSSAGSPTGDHHQQAGGGAGAGAAGGASGGQPGQGGQQRSTEEIAEERVELYCNDKLLDPNMDLRTVKHLIWKSSSDLVLNYKPLR